MPEDNKPAAAKPAKDDSNDVLMGVLAYLGILCLIPLLAAKDSEFAQFHAKQGVTLFAIEIGIVLLQWVIGFIALMGGFGFFALISLLVWIVWLGVLVLSVIGIINAVGKKMTPLPIVGGIKIIK
jgi:uncharacterized membrane protein